MTEEPKDPEGASAEGGAPISHANQLRRAEFKKLMGKVSTWLWLVGLSVVAGGIFGAMAAPAIGLIVFLVVFLGILLVVFFIADGRAEDAFYDSYCSTHGLTRVAGPNIGELTPLLRKGDKTDTNEMFQGELAPGIDGSLVLYTYTEVHRDSDGDETETDYPFTIIHVEMPEIVEHLPELTVENAGFKLFDKLEDKFGGHERVTLESEAFHKRYEVFVQKGQDQVWVRRLFSPTWIVWLTEQTPKDFAFELENGNLIAYVPRHRDDVAGLEAITKVGTDVAARLREEVAETSPRVAHENDA